MRRDMMSVVRACVDTMLVSPLTSAGVPRRRGGTVAAAGERKFQNPIEQLQRGGRV